MKYVVTLILFFFYYPLFSQHSDFADNDFTRPDSIAINYQFKGKIDPIKIANDLTKDLTTDIEKFRVIFRWISENIEYDVKLYLKTVSHDYDPRLWPKRSARWHKRLNRLYTKHTIKKRATICEGYAWLLTTMCSVVDIPNEIVYGYARTEDHVIGRPFRQNHAWNAVKINNKWYLTDPTWASGFVNPQFTRFTKDFDPIYFLVDPGTFIANHYPVDKSWMLQLQKPTLSEFFNAPIKTSAFLKNRVVHYAPLEGQAVVDRDSLFSFSFTMNNVLKSISAEASIFRNSKYSSEQLFFTLEQNSEGYYSISHAFSQKGEYHFRIYINRRLTFIYRIRVV